MEGKLSGVLKIILLIYCVWLNQGISASGQTAVFDIDGNRSGTLLQHSDRFPWLREDEVIEGTPYLNGNYVNGTVFFKDAVYPNVPLRYNLASGMMEFKNNGKEIGINPDLAIRKIIIDSSVFVVDLLRNSASFFLRLDSGSMVLLKKVESKFYERVPAKAMQDAKNAHFKRLKDTYYYRLNRGPVVKIDNVKRFLESLPEKKSEMTTYIEREKIRLKEEGDYRKVIKYFNSL